MISALTASLTVLAALPYEIDLQIFPPSFKGPIVMAGTIATLLLRLGRPFLKLIIARAEVTENNSQAQPAAVIEVPAPAATTVVIEKQPSPPTP